MKHADGKYRENQLHDTGENGRENWYYHTQ